MKPIPILKLILPLPPIIYLGCWEQRGHYFYIPGMQQLYQAYRNSEAQNYKELCKLDGGFAPQDTTAEGEAWYHCWHLIDNVWCLVISFWDNSVDRRPGSNSTFLLLRRPLSFSEAIQRCSEEFPEVFARFKFEVKLRKNMFA
jgi:hypothetical protein